MDIFYSQQFRSIHFKNQSTEFRKLNLCSLKTYEVPAEYMNIEQAVPPQIIDLLRSTHLYRRSQSLYINAYSTMIHLEEAAQALFLTQFNAKSVTLQYSGSGRDFSIRKNVLN